MHKGTLAWEGHLVSPHFGGPILNPELQGGDVIQENDIKMLSYGK